jgi:hypothetical protein
MSDALVIAEMSLGAQLRADATAELQRTVDEARHRYTIDPEFHARVKMLCQTMELRGRVMDAGEAIEVMSALVMVERRTERMNVPTEEKN